MPQSTTVTAIFDDLGDAQQAARELDAIGIDRERVRIMAASSLPGDVGGRASPLAGWSGMLRWPGKREATRAGSIALLAQVERSLIPAAVTILRRYGATRVDQHPQSGDGAVTSAAARPRPEVLERQVERPIAVREEVVDVERRPAERPAGEDDLESWSRFADGRQPASGPSVLPVLEERLEIDKKRRETGRVRVRKDVEREERTVQESFVEQTYDVEHVPVNREVAEPPEPRYEGDTLVLPVVEEVLVVEKRLMLREEVRITRKREERVNPRTHTLRRERVHLERTYPK